MIIHLHQFRKVVRSVYGMPENSKDYNYGYCRGTYIPLCLNTFLIEIVKVIFNEPEICHYCLHSNIKVFTLHPNESIIVQINVRIDVKRLTGVNTNIMIVFSC